MMAPAGFSGSLQGYSRSLPSSWPPSLCIFSPRSRNLAFQRSRCWRLGWSLGRPRWWQEYWSSRLLGIFTQPGRPCRRVGELHRHLLIHSWRALAGIPCSSAVGRRHRDSHYCQSHPASGAVWQGYRARMGALARPMVLAQAAGPFTTAFVLSTQGAPVMLLLMAAMVAVALDSSFKLPLNPVQRR
ncbi:hypothetical protein D3C76_556320 [compost metagenome]